MTEVIHPVSRDKRYTIRHEDFGYGEPRWVLRFDGEHVKDSFSIAALVTRAVCHHAAANGAPIFENIPAH